MTTNDQAALSTLATDLRPALLRLCGRMMGSLMDGEDIVQETLATAVSQLESLRDPTAMRPWLFRIAYNKCLNALSARARRAHDVDADASELPSDVPAVDESLAHGQAVNLAIARFLELVPSQRACVVMKDVLGHSLDEIGVALDMTVMAVKAALHRGRMRLVEVARAPQGTPGLPAPTFLRYAELFNARDWDGLRALLARDVRLDLHGREVRRGAQAVGGYFENYATVVQQTDLRAGVAYLDGREVIVLRQGADVEPLYAVDLICVGDRIRAIRDFRYDRDVLVEAVYTMA